MTRSIPSIATPRAPDATMYSASLSRITRANIALARVQEQLATGRSILRPSDDAVRASTIAELDLRIERSEQRQRNVSHATAAINVLDDALGEISDLAQDARRIGLTEIGSTSDRAARALQAPIVQSILNGLYNASNRESVSGFALSGSTPGEQPFEAVGGGYRWNGRGTGITTDLGLSSLVPVTLGGDDAIGGTSARVRGSIDLAPRLEASTRISDLDGARGLGVSLASVDFSVNGGARVSVDLTGADSAGQIAERLQSAIRAHETSSGTTVLGSEGVTFSGEAFRIDIAGSASVRFFESGTGAAARDLGLATDSGFSFAATDEIGEDLGVRLSWRTSVSALDGVSGPLGSIRLRNNGAAAVVDLSAASTLEDIKNAIEGAGLWMRVDISSDGRSIDVLSDVAAGSAGAMSVEEVTGSNFTASRLGIRTFDESTALSSFRFGQGVRFVDGATDPITGAPDPAGDVDFTITLGDASSTVISIDLRPEDIATVETVLARINEQASTQLIAAGLPATALTASVSDGANGIMLTQSASFGTAIKVGRSNNSGAAGDLGLLDGSYDASSATFAGADGARVRVTGLFSDLIDLRDALAGDDTSGIGVALNDIEDSFDRLVQIRGTVGGYAQRVDVAGRVEEDRSVIDTSVRSELRDVDFAEASSRYSLLTTQLEAGLRTTASLSSLSLLDFLQ